MASLDETEISFQTQDNVTSDATNDLTSFQFVPEKIVDFNIGQDGQRSYRVEWKDSWLTEELLALTYQHLINDFWAAAVQATKPREQTKKLRKTKLQGKQLQYETNYQPIAPQPQTDTTSPSNDHAISLKDVAETQTATSQIIDQNNTSIDSQQLSAKVVSDTVVDTNSLSTIVVDTDVSLAVNELQYHEINPALLNQPIPKYQQALQQPVTIQQQDLVPDDQGKVTFPKHVFSQARYVNKKQQQLHAVTDQQRVQCDICQKSLKTKKMLWAHKVAVHYGGNFPCNICGKKCITGAELRRHMTSHSSERKFVCQYCGLSYKRWSHLYQHLRVHEEEKNFRCDVCHNNFKVQSELKDHCFAEHSSGEIVKCSVCQHKLQTPLAVYYHSMKHTGTRDFICEICGSNFKRKQHLVTHMKTHLTDKRTADGDPEVFNCQACDEKFTLKMDLKAHCDEAHPCDGSEGVINCKTCGKKLNLSHSVYLHGLRHCGSRDFQCNQCDQMFKRKAHLLRHQLDRHPTEPRERKKRTVHSESIVCTLCTKSFIYKAALIKHMAMQHGIFPRSDGEIVIRRGLKKRHQCDICQKRFRVKANLVKHKLNRHSSATNVQQQPQEQPEITEGTSNIAESTTEPNNIMIDMSITDDIPINHTQNNSDLDLNTTESSIYNNPVVSTASIDTASTFSELSKSEEQNGSKIKDNIVTVYTPTDEQQPMLRTMPGQVITLDQNTGSIILMQAESLPQTPLMQGESSATNKENMLQMTSIANDESRNIENSTFSEAIDTVVVSSVQQLNSNNSVVQMLDENTTSLSTLPLPNPDNLSDTQNVIDFANSNTEQIVVLLSALNSQNIDSLE